MNRFAAILCVLVLAGCSRSSSEAESASSPDSLSTELSEAVSDSVGLPALSVNIDYNREYNDSVLANYTFMPFEKVYQAAQRAFAYEDSVRHADENGMLDPKDSIASLQVIDQAYEILMAYQKQMEQGMKLEPLPSFRRPKGLTEDDESYELLTRTESTLLTNKSFAFLGGAPFVNRLEGVFTSPNGTAESRYAINIPENTQFLFNYAYRFNNSPVEMSYGRPIHTYDAPDAEIRGIGSLIHTLKQRIPVVFITEKGAIPAQLVSVDMKLAWEYGCVSSLPEYVFACAQNLSADEVLGVFVSPTPIPMAKLSVTYPNSNLWMADLDGDGEAEFACVNSTFAGAAGDQMAETIWFAMVNDNWVVIDYGSEPDCT